MNLTDDLRIRSVSPYYKTKMCPFLKYTTGGNVTCKNGSKCNFAHSKNELKATRNLKHTRLCMKFMNGACKEAQEDCDYAHGQQNLKWTPEFYKTTICKYYQKGFECPQGENCRHAHGDHELRRNENVEHYEAKKEKKVVDNFFSKDQSNQQLQHMLSLTSSSTTTRVTPVHSAIYNCPSLNYCTTTSSSPYCNLTHRCVDLSDYGSENVSCKSYMVDHHSKVKVLTEYFSYICNNIGFMEKDRLVRQILTEKPKLNKDNLFDLIYIITEIAKNIC